MKRLFTADANAELLRVMLLRPLLAFDFDGTLAPIVARPDDAAVPMPTARRLSELAALLPVAVITGRRVADVRPRLGFEPWQVVGSHGAEDPVDPTSGRHVATLDGARALLNDASGALSAAGVRVEDKGASMALHYRLARDRARAEAAIQQVVARLGDEVRARGGKMVVNLTPADANDKALALRQLVQRAGAGAAVFVGDDANDEPVFASDEPDWFTVRVGSPGTASRAAYFLGSTRLMPRLLDAMLGMLAPPPA